MENIWAPWRMDYILDDNKEKGCFLCDALKKKDGKENLVILRKKHSFAILNKFPYNNGHVMVAPVRHLASLDDLTEEELLDLMLILRKTQGVLQKALNPDGFNIGINIGRVAGAGLPGHIHIHVVPRWNGDVNFMPVIADTKVMPEYLEKTYDKLRDVVV
ncbi:HIT domain-containing protein [bacterium]|nr:HIT domain-containing protein [bacterium]